LEELDINDSEHVLPEAAEASTPTDLFNIDNHLISPSFLEIDGKNNASDKYNI